MKKSITGIFAGALSVVALFWAFDAMGRTGHGGTGHHDAAFAFAGHGADAGHADAAEGAEAGPADGAVENSDADFADADVRRTRLSRRAAARLELTDEQREEIKTLRSAFARDMVQLRADTKLARIELRELMSETRPDVDKVRELAAAVSAAQGSVFERGAVFRAEFRNVLTAEQQEKLRESFRDRRDGRRDAGMRWRRGGRESLDRADRESRDRR